MGLVQHASNHSNSASTLTVTLGSAATLGNCLIVCVSGTRISGSYTVTGITIGGSADNFAQAVTQANAGGGNTAASIWTDQNIGTSSTSVVVSFSTAIAANVDVYEWNGIVTTSAVDKTNSSTTAGSGSWTSGSTGTLTQSAEVAFGCECGAANTGSITFTGPGSPWTNSAQLSSTSGSAPVCQLSGYQQVSATSALTYNGTSSNSGTFSACVIATLELVTSTTHSGTATLSGTGTLTATGAFGGSATLSGSGTLSWSGSRILKATALSGTGTLSGTVIGTINVTAALSGTGTLSAMATATLLQTAALSGTGTLAVSGVRLGFQVALSGTGTLSIIGTGGTVQAAAGPAVPYAYPGSSQVAVAAPGSTSWQYLGTLGVITALTYSFVCPGGADKLTATIMIPATYRTQFLNPGWQVRVTRGGHVCWTGKLDEPVPTAQGWTLTAVGDGNRGTDFRAVYSGTWPSGIPDDPINEAISRGLPWVNTGVGTPAGLWTGQAQDSGSMTITDLLNLVCTRGGLVWYANSQPGGQPGTDLSVFPLPVTINRLLVVTDPVARTLGGDINTIWLRYEISDGTATGTSATYGLTSVENTASANTHQVMEAYIDLSSAGVLTAAQAQIVGVYVLSIYQRASFTGPFTASYGHLLNAGGAPIDPGTDQAGTVCRLILTDFAYGGEVSTAPIFFIVGGYQWDDFAQKATITPYQTLNQSLSGLLALENTLLTPITTQA